jgi:IS5 family transposase
VAQTRTRLAGQVPEGATRLVSLHNPDARPIRKGRIDKPVEYGDRAPVADNDDGIILDYSVEYGAAPDGPLLAPAGGADHPHPPHTPRGTANRGYGYSAVESNLQALGVRSIVIPRQATTPPARKAAERQRSFRPLVKWRTGSEGRISYLKRGYRWDRTGWTAGTEPRSGAGTGYSPTTWSRWRHGQLPARHASPGQMPTPRPASALGVFQVEVAIHP